MRHRNAKKLAPIHPGTILREDLEDVGVSINQLGREMRVPVNRISAIVNGQRGITADTALRLAQYFGNSPQYWMNLQALYDLEAVDPAKREEIQRDVRTLPIGAKTQYRVEKKKPGPQYRWSRA
jgi:addiction module HigA family antidote